MVATITERQLRELLQPSWACRGISTFQQFEPALKEDSLPGNKTPFMRRKQVQI